MFLSLFTLAGWMAFFERAFFVSPDGFDLIIWPAASVALLFVGTYLATLKGNKTTVPPNVPGVSSFSRFTKWVVMPIGLALFGGWVVSASVPCVLNKVVGGPFEERMTVSGKEKISGRAGVNCHEVLLRELGESRYGRLCVDPREFEAIRLGQQLRINGVRSRFGTEIVGYAM